MALASDSPGVGICSPRAAASHRFNPCQRLAGTDVLLTRHAHGVLLSEVGGLFAVAVCKVHRVAKSVFFADASGDIVIFRIGILEVVEVVFRVLPPTNSFRLPADTSTPA